MKIGMFAIGEPGRRVIGCRFLCSACGKPIERLDEANFAPPTDEFERDTRIRRGLTLMTDKIEVFHLECDEAGVPWVKASLGLLAGYPDELGQPVQHPSYSKSR